MHEMFKKDQIITIPNIMSLFRIALIPFIVWLYIGCHEYYWAVAVIALSGLTDVTDGYIARHYDMVSDVGKILDPLADKLTQLTLIICLAYRYSWMFLLIILFVVKELVQALLGFLALRKEDIVHSAGIYGKISTAVIYAVVIILILVPMLPIEAVNSFIAICAACLALALVAYAQFYLGIIRGKGNGNDDSAADFAPADIKIKKAAARENETEPIWKKIEHLDKNGKHI